MVDEVSMAPSISLILPCWQDDLLAEEMVIRWRSHPLLREIFVAGAPACCKNQEELEGLGAICTMAESAGRGAQMNTAAALATGDLLVFHHLDSQLEGAHLISLVEVMRDSKCVGGAFHRHFDERHPHLRWLEPIERWHCRSFGTLYGDQSIFVRRRVFEALGGFANYPLMEDVEFSKRLRRQGPLAVIDPPMKTSPRRHLEYGAWRVTLMNVMLLTLYHLGVSPSKLHQMYYPERLKNRNPAAQPKIKIKQI